MSENVKVLACPHCWATAEALDKDRCKGVYVYPSALSSDMETMESVVCLECECSAPSVKAWNRRVK